MCCSINLAECSLNRRFSMFTCKGFIEKIQRVWMTMKEWGMWVKMEKRSTTRVLCRKRACWRFPRDCVIYERSTPFPHSNQKTVARVSTFPLHPTNYLCFKHGSNTYGKTTTTTTTKRGNCWYWTVCDRRRIEGMLGKDWNIVSEIMIFLVSKSKGFQFRSILGVVWEIGKK